MKKTKKNNYLMINKNNQKIKIFNYFSKIKKIIKKMKKNKIFMKKRRKKKRKKKKKKKKNHQIFLL